MGRHLPLALAALCLAACRSDADPQEHDPGTPPTPMSGAPAEVPHIPVGKTYGGILSAAESWTIYALDPYPHEVPPTEGRDFHGYHVRGEATLTDLATRAEVAAALIAGMEGNDDMVAACFDPRHGIRATSASGTVDLVICFECLQVYVFEPGDAERRSMELTTSDPKVAFNRVWRAAGLDIAP